MPVSNVRPSLERLHARNAPSDLGGNSVASPDWMTDPSDPWLPGFVAPPAAEEPSGNRKPTLTDFEVTINPGWVGVFSGRVTDESVTTVTIRFGGSPECLDEQTTTVNADGEFSFEGQLRAPQDAGFAWAEPVDAQGLVGDYKEVAVFVG